MRNRGLLLVFATYLAYFSYCSTVCLLQRVAADGGAEEQVGSGVGGYAGPGFRNDLLRATSTYCGLLRIIAAYCSAVRQVLRPPPTARPRGRVADYSKSRPFVTASGHGRQIAAAKCAGAGNAPAPPTAPWRKRGAPPPGAAAGAGSGGGGGRVEGIERARAMASWA